jgi:hypothetical protein
MRKIIIAMVVLLLFSSVSAIDASRYELAAQTDDAIYYFDTCTLQIKQDDHNEACIDVWLKYQVSDKWRQTLIENMGPDFNNLNNILAHLYFKQFKYADIRETFYAEDGKVIKSFDHSPLEWKDIVPESLFEAIDNKIAQYLTVHPELYPK